METLLWFAHSWGTLGLFVVIALCVERVIHEMENH